jgi:hypothetical protein
VKVWGKVSRAEVIEESTAGQGGAGLAPQATEEHARSLRSAASEEFAQGMDASGVDDGHAFQAYDQCPGWFGRSRQYCLRGS